MISDVLYKAIEEIKEYQRFKNDIYDISELKIRFELDLHPKVIENINDEEINELYKKLHEITDKIQTILEQETSIFLKEEKNFK